jgi:GTP pyrophosphokinase
LQLGERLLAQALRQQGVDAALMSDDVWEKLLHWTGAKSRQDVMGDIALGRRAAAIIAKRIQLFIQETSGGEQMRLDADNWDEHTEKELLDKHRQALIVDGNEGMSVNFASCCHPIPGDEIIGYLGKGEGLQIHTDDCAYVRRIHHKDPENWIEVVWAAEIQREFEVAVKVDVKNSKGVLAKVASSITSADANIVHVAMEDSFSEASANIRFGIQVKDRIHLARVMRSLRSNADVVRVARV